MIIYGMRHAIAEPGGPGVSDDARALTPEGERKLAEIVAGLQALDVRPGKIWTSPYRRAAQTAAAVALALGVKEIQESALLTPGHSPAEVWSELLRGSPEEKVMCVGHEPLLSDLASYLLTGGRAASIQMKRGAVFAVEVDPLQPPGTGVLLFLLQPRHARGAGR